LERGEVLFPPQIWPDITTHRAQHKVYVSKSMVKQNRHDVNGLGTSWNIACVNPGEDNAHRIGCCVYLGDPIEFLLGYKDE
jgi:hypothetical protein